MLQNLFYYQRTHCKSYYLHQVSLTSNMVALIRNGSFQHYKCTSITYTDACYLYRTILKLNIHFLWHQTLFRERLDIRGYYIRLSLTDWFFKGISIIGNNSQHNMTEDMTWIRVQKCLEKYGDVPRLSSRKSHVPVNPSSIAF